MFHGYWGVDAMVGRVSGAQQEGIGRGRLVVEEIVGGVNGVGIGITIIIILLLLARPCPLHMAISIW